MNEKCQSIRWSVHNVYKKIDEEMLKCIGYSLVNIIYR